MKSIILLLLLGCVFASKFNLEKEWQIFKLQFDKNYATREEEQTRKENFKRVSMLIESHNKKYAQGKSTFWLKMNQFGDMTKEEFKNTVLMKNPARPKTSAAQRFYKPTGAAVPASQDWRNYGIITPVKDQGQCGSCWAFSATGALEAYHALATGQLISESEQNLVDCTLNLGNYGCDGGWMDTAWNYIASNGGVDTEVSYPYEAVNSVCRYNSGNNCATVARSVYIQQDDAAIKEVVGNHGPVAITIDASSEYFMYYAGGIYNDATECDPNWLTHAPLIIGYEGDSYWYMKNSWGTWWGEQGYVRYSMSPANLCGVAMHAMYPDV